MSTNEFLNEAKYQESALKLKKIGKVLLIIGVIILIVGAFLTVFGFLNFGKSAIDSFNSISLNTNSIFGNFSMVTIGIIMDSVGSFLTMAGFVVTIIAHKREITAFGVQQVMPVAQEGIDKMAPTIGNAAKEISKGIKEGINEANNK